eukprot:gene6782-7547_t
MATCPRKFSDAQVSLLELEFNSGLCSTSLKKFGDRITTLAKRTGLRESDVQCWINNRKRGPAPSCFPSESGEEIGQQPTKRPLLATKIKRRPSGYNLFSGNIFSNELRGYSITEKNCMASQRWKNMPENERSYWNELAEQQERPSLEDLSELQKKKLVDGILHRIDCEMQTLEQYGGRGITLIFRPYDQKLIVSSTTADQNFLMTNKDIVRRFSEFAGSKDTQGVTIKTVQSILNEKYRSVFDKVNVEYSKYKTKFDVEGWPDNVPFRQPSKLGSAQLNAVYGARDRIVFQPIMVTHPASREEEMQINNFELEIENAEPQEIINQLEEIISQQDVQNSPSDEQEAAVPEVAKQRAKRNSFVKKGDVIPVLAPQQDATPFWLFWCSSKAKTSGIVNGKWLDQIGDSCEFRLLPAQASTVETCVLWNPNKNAREVLSDDSFEVKNAKKGVFKISTASYNFLKTLACSQTGPL